MSCQCSLSSGWRNLAPVPAASWLGLWVWEHGSFPCPYKDLGWSSTPSLLGSYHCWKQPPPVSYQLNSFLTSSIQHHSNDAFHLAECFADLGCWHTGRRGGSWGGRVSGSSLLFHSSHSNSTFRSLTQWSTHVFILSSSVTASSPASLRTQFSPIMSWFVQSICLAIMKALPHAWRSCRWSLLGVL